MPHIPFTIRTLGLATELGVPIPPRRPFVVAEFLGPQGLRIHYPTFFDTGSSYGVIPHTLAMQVIWKSLGTQAVSAGNARPLTWEGLPCTMGELEMELMDKARRIRSRRLRVVAKIPSQPAPPVSEKAAILGMNFLWDNGLRQEMDATGVPGSGHFWVP